MRSVRAALEIVGTFLQRVKHSEVIVMEIATADAPFIVKHNLGATPTYAHGYGAVNAHTYCTTDDEREWNSKTIKLRYPSTGRVRILVAA